MFRITLFFLVILLLGLIISFFIHIEPYSFVTKWGSLGVGDGEFNEPYSVAVDSHGNVYVADSKNYRIQKFDRDGNYLTQWGSYGEGDEQFLYPRDIAVDSSDNVYVVDSTWEYIPNPHILKFDSNGKFIMKIHLIDRGGLVATPRGVAVDSLGNIYVGDSSERVIKKFDSNGKFITTMGQGLNSEPIGIAVDSLDNIYVSSKDKNIRKFDNNGNLLMLFSISSSSYGDSYTPSGIAVDSLGNIYVISNYLIKKFDSSGNFIATWGSYGSGNGQFKNPKGATVDSSDNVYVADTKNNRIQEFAINDNGIVINISESTKYKIKLLRELLITILGIVLIIISRELITNLAKDLYDFLKRQIISLKKRLFGK